jgi:hypothetical protein
MRNKRVRSRTSQAAIHLACAVLACALPTIDARARASYEDGSTVTAAAVRSPPARSSVTEPRGAVKSIQAGTAQAVGAMGRSAADISANTGSSTPHREVRRSTRGQAERLRPGPSALARGPAVRDSTHNASAHTPTGNRAATSPRGAGQWAGAALPLRQPPLRPAGPSVNFLRSSAVGKSHAVGGARLGGPAIGRTSSSASLDGAQMHRK